MFKFKFSLILILGLFAPVLETFADGNVKAEYIIAVAEHPVQFEKKAADELKLFMDRINGMTIKIVAESRVKADGPQAVIYIGRTKFARENKVDFNRAGKEEWILKSVGKNIIISGGRPVGTLYGVYRLLEKLGVYFLTKDCTALPKNRISSIPRLDESGKPAFPGRNIYDGFSWPAFATKVPEKIVEEYWLYRLRSRLNGGHGIVGKGIMNAMYLGDMFNLTMSYHTFSYYVDPKLFAKHPEYFSMGKDGKRFKPKYFSAEGSLCLSNKEVWQVALDSLRKYIKRDRTRLPEDKWPTVYDISTLDNTPYICFCPECAKIVKAEGGDCGLVLRFINYVATGIAREYPDIKIRTFAYSSTKDVPKITRPAANVLIQYCDEFPVSDCYRPLSSKFNTEMMKNLKKWYEAGARLVLWDYWNMGGRFFNPPRIETVTDAIQPDMRTFRSLGIQSLFIEAEKDQTTPQNFIDLNYFLAAQLMIDPDKDQEKLINVFIENYYGPASPEMKKYLQILRNGVSSHSRLQRTMRVGRWNFITTRFMIDSYLMFKQAENKTSPRSQYRKRLHYEMIPLLWQMLMSYPGDVKKFQKAKISEDTLKQECREYCLEFIKRNNPAKPEKYIKEFDKKFAALSTRLPVPEKFKRYGEGDIRIYGYPQFRPMPHVFCKMIDDPESPTGKALMSANPNPAFHGTKKTVSGKNGKIKWAFRTTKFEVGCQDVRKYKNITLEKVAQDEKYHWYLIPRAEVSSKCLLWGHCWAIQVDLSQAYQLADGISDNNVWNVWMSLKFTGQEWVRGSKKKNAIYLDQVVLVRPNAKVQKKGGI